MIIAGLVYTSGYYGCDTVQRVILKIEYILFYAERQNMLQIFDYSQIYHVRKQDIQIQQTASQQATSQQATSQQATSQIPDGYCMPPGFPGFFQQFQACWKEIDHGS